MQKPALLERNTLRRTSLERLTERKQLEARYAQAVLAGVEFRNIPGEPIQCWHWRYHEVDWRGPYFSKARAVRAALERLERGTQ